MTQTWEERRTKDREERIADIRRLAAAGLSVKDVASAIGVRSSSMHTFLDRAGESVVFTRKAYTKNPAADSANVKKYAERLALSKSRPRLTCEEAAEHLGVNARALRSYSAGHDLEWRPARSWA